jgi:hypothetical protein
MVHGEVSGYIQHIYVDNPGGWMPHEARFSPVDNKTPLVGKARFSGASIYKLELSVGSMKSELSTMPARLPERVR